VVENKWNPLKTRSLPLKPDALWKRNGTDELGAVASDGVAQAAEFQRRQRRPVVLVEDVQVLGDLPQLLQRRRLQLLSNRSERTAMKKEKGKTR